MDLYSPLLKKSSLFFSTMGKTLVLEILKETCERNFPSNEAGQQDWEARCKISHHILEQCDLKYHWPTLFSANEWGTPWKKQCQKRLQKKYLQPCSCRPRRAGCALQRSAGVQFEWLASCVRSPPQPILPTSGYGTRGPPKEMRQGCHYFVDTKCMWIFAESILYIYACVFVYAYVYIIIINYIYIHWYVCVWGVLVSHCWFKNLLANYPCWGLLNTVWPHMLRVHLFESSKNFQKAKAHHSARPAQPSGQGISPCPRLCNWIAWDDWAIHEDINQLILSTHWSSPMMKKCTTMIQCDGIIRETIKTAQSY